MALNFMLWGLYFFFRYLRLEKLPNLLLASLCSILAIYTYHSSKVTIPLLLLFLFFKNLNFFKKKGTAIIITAIFSITLLYPFVKDSFLGEGLTRASSMIFAQGYTALELLKKLLSNTLSYFSLDFLISGKNLGNYRHGDGKFGVIEPISLILIIFYLFFKKNKNKLISTALMMVICGLLPAIMADGQSSSNRSLLALPGFILLVVLAARSIYEVLETHKKVFFTALITLYLAYTSLYQINYYRHYPQKNADDFLDGYLETMTYLRQLDRSKVKQIVFTNDYQQAYIYALFAFEVSPIAYQGGILNLFFFTDKIDASDLEKADTIVVASKFDQMGDRQADRIIKGSDGQGRFFIYLPL